MLSAPMMGDCTNDTMMFSGLDSVSQNTVPPTLCGDLTGHESRNFSNLFVSEVEANPNNCSVRDGEVRHGRGQDRVQHRLDGEQLQVQDQGGAALLRGHRHPRPRRLRHLQRRHLGLHHLLQQRQRSRRGEVIHK